MKKLKARIRKRKIKQQIPKKYNSYKITPERFLNALIGTEGNSRIIAQRLNVQYFTVRNYIKNASEDIKELIKIEKEKVGDIAEEMVVEMMLQSIHYPTKLNASKFVLTNGPESNKKGYKNKAELTVEGGKTPLTVRNEKVMSLDELKDMIPIEVRKRLLEKIKKKEEEEKDG